MNTGFKAAALAGGVGSAAGAGALAHKLSQDQRATIQDLFSKSTTKILLDSQGESEEWKKVGTSYKDKDPWNIGNKQSQEAPKELKDKCVALLKEKVSGESDDIYSQFVLYCSRNKAVKDALKEQGFSLASQNNNDTFGQGRFDKYKAASSDKKIPNITIASGDNHSTNGNLDKLKKGCLDAFNKPITEASYMNVLNNIKEGCSAEFKANE